MIETANSTISIKDILALKSRSDFERDTRISIKNDYIYSMISKAASSTVTYHLQFAELRKTPFSVHNVNKAIMSPHLLPYQLKMEMVLEMLANNAVRKVAFVRNPYTRLLSCYLHRIVGTKNSNPSKRVLRRASRREDLQDIGFADFINCICDQPSVQMERHWCVQHDSILYPLVRYDFIGRMETLVDDLISAEKLLFHTGALRRKAFNHSKLNSINKAPMKTGANDKLREYYDDKLMARVANRFAIDFETFGYSTELPV